MSGANDASDRRPLLTAVWTRDRETVRRLVRDGTADAYEQWLAVKRLVEEGDLALLDVMLDAGTPVDVADEIGTTALMWAAWRDRPSLARRLLTAGADVETSDRNGWTALFHAVRGESAESVRLLLDAGADTTRIDREKRSILQVARTKRFVLQVPFTRLRTEGMRPSRGNPEIVRMLIESGAR